MDKKITQRITIWLLPLILIGGLFVKPLGYLVTTIIAILLGIPLKARAWCALCPMGTLQSKIGSLKKGKNENVDR